MRLRLIAATCAILSAGLPVLADSFTLTFTDGTGTGNVLLTGNDISTPDEYLIASATGTINGLNVVALVPPGQYPSPTVDIPNDDLLFQPLSLANPSYFDENGIAFVLFGGEYINLFNDGQSYFTVSGAVPTLEDPPVLTTDLAVSPTPIPEPSTILLLGTGLLGAAGAIRRRIS